MVLVQKQKHVGVVNKLSLFICEVVSTEYKSKILGFLIVLFAGLFICLLELQFQCLYLSVQTVISPTFCSKNHRTAMK